VSKQPGPVQFEFIGSDRRSCVVLEGGDVGKFSDVREPGGLCDPERAKTFRCAPASTALPAARPVQDLELSSANQIRVEAWVLKADVVVFGIQPIYVTTTVARFVC
jgi:hypothetical protein